MRQCMFCLSLALVSWTAAPLAAQEKASYARDVRPFLAKYCLECHNAKAMKGGLSLDTFAALHEGGDGGAVLEPRQPDKSRLVLLIEGKDEPLMPPKKIKNRPTKTEIALVRAWVAAGAKDDSAALKVALPDIKPRTKALPPVAALAFAPQGNLLFAARGQKLHQVELPHQGSDAHFDASAPTSYPALIGALALSRQGKTLALALNWPGEKGVLELLAQPLLPEKPFRFPCEIEHKDAILDVAFSPDGKLVATCGYDTQVKLSDVATGKVRHTLKEHSDAVYGAAFSPDSKLLATCSADRALKVWDVTAGTLVYTLGEATDCLYAVAWSPDGRRLAAAGADKSIRVYEPGPTSAKLLQSVFAHEAPVLKLAFAPDGRTLYSIGQDRVAKAWDVSRMSERKIYERQPESILSLAVAPDGTSLALGRFDGTIVCLNTATGARLCAVSAAAPPDKAKPIPEKNAGSSPATGQKIPLPATVAGSLDRAGDVDFYRFDVRQGQQLGVHLVAAASAKLEPTLQLCDLAGHVLAESNSSQLGYTFAAAGTYALGVRDRDFRGGKEMTYQLHMGELPVVTAIFPLGARRGTSVDVQVEGVFLDQKLVRVQVPAGAAVGSTVPIAVTSKHGTPLGLPQLIVGEFPEVAVPGPLAVPSTANGRLASQGQRDVWSFAAHKGEQLVIEVNAARIGSDIDSIIEILDKDNQPVPRALLRCQAKAYIAFRDHDSANRGIRLEAWSELAINDYLYVGNELIRIEALPANPDADCIFFNNAGRRLGYLDTTPTHHSMGAPLYKVTLHPPGTSFAPNGFPVFTLYYRNDDGGSGYGRDSRILFDPPADGEYRVRIRDAGAQAGPRYGYRLTVRPPRPDFNVRFTPTAPVVWKGGALPLALTADRLDGYEGPIEVHFAGLPAGLSIPATTIEAGTFATAIPLFAEAGAKLPEKMPPLKLVAEANVAGRKLVKEVVGQAPKLAEPGDIVTTTEQATVAIQPGGEVRMTVHIERRNGFTGRVPLEVRGLPHGVRVLDIGLNGILVLEGSTRRTVTLQADPWVRPTERPIVILARREGKNTEHAARAVLLKVQEK
jgi:hypothetical protein